MQLQPVHRLHLSREHCKVLAALSFWGEVANTLAHTTALTTALTAANGGARRQW